MLLRLGGILEDGVCAGTRNCAASWKTGACSGPRRSARHLNPTASTSSPDTRSLWTASSSGSSACCLGCKTSGVRLRPAHFLFSSHHERPLDASDPGGGVTPSRYWHHRRRLGSGCNATVVTVLTGSSPSPAQELRVAAQLPPASAQACCRWGSHRDRRRAHISLPPRHGGRVSLASCPNSRRRWRTLDRLGSPLILLSRLLHGGGVLSAHRPSC
jgi:hypothetical protein